MANDRIGWRLSIEPLGDEYAWSLIRQDDTGTQVWADVVDDATSLRTEVEGLVNATDPAGSSLADLVGEAGVATRLSVLLPRQLRQELRGSDASHTATIAVRGWPSRVPWPALILDPSGTRLIERCRLVGGLPTGVLSTHQPRPVSTAGAGLLIADPGPLTGAEPPIYPNGYPEQWYAAAGADRLVPDGLAYSPDDLADDLQRGGMDRLLFLGHVRSGPVETPGAAALVLSDRDRAAPLTAQSWFAQPERWPAPRSVALIGCGSDDAIHYEQTGLAMAALAAGAHHVLATRWVLPAGSTGHAGITELALAVLYLQRARHVVTELARWQRARLAAWRASGAPEASPLLWASLVAYTTPTDWADDDE